MQKFLCYNFQLWVSNKWQYHRIVTLFSTQYASLGSFLEILECLRKESKNLCKSDFDTQSNNRGWNETQIHFLPINIWIMDSVKSGYTKSPWKERRLISFVGFVPGSEFFDRCKPAAISTDECYYSLSLSPLRHAILIWTDIFTSTNSPCRRFIKNVDDLLICHHRKPDLLFSPNFQLYAHELVIWISLNL